MRSILTGVNCTVAALAWLAVPVLALMAAPASTDTKPAGETAGDKNRKAMEQTISIEFQEQPLQAVLAQLGEQSKLKFVMDRATLNQLGGADPDLPITIKLQDVKVRSALRSILGQYNLGYVMMEDSVLITTEEMALYRQMRQRVNLDLDEVPLPTALKQLARNTNTNLVLDPRVGKDAKTTAVTLQLEDVPLETAVRLMAEVAGLKSVRVGNVLFVTTESRADKLRAEPESTPPPNSPNGSGIEKVIPPQPPMAVPAPPANPAGVAPGEVPPPAREKP
ncbi:MAG: hypothetical protein K2R98_12690 [Gemmataceae bacterium]|nr:hypothetical protein [Gemmataceae bacterium]